MLNALLEKGVDPSTRPAKPSNGETALHFAVRRNSIAMVERLLQASAPLNFPDDRSSTLLGEAAYGGSVHIARLLLEHGAKVEGSSTSNRPLFEAISSPNSGTRPQMMKLLIEWRANVNAKDDCEPSLLFHTVRRDYFPEAKLLLAAGANINAIMSHGYTALNYAINARSLSQFQFLTENGADIPPMESLSFSEKAGLKWLLNAAEEAREKEAKASLSKVS
jgi:ankyrin repeat protein